MSARGGPDYGNPAYTSAANPLDMSSMILALKGVHSIDGLGRVIFVENFAEGLYSWITTSNGLYPNVVVSAGEALIPPAALKFPAQVDGVSATAYHRLYEASGSRIGFEVCVDFEDLACKFQMDTFAYSPTTERGMFGRLTWNSSTKLWKFGPGAGVTILDWSSLSDIQGGWLPIKVVVDPETVHGVRVNINGIKIDVSSIPLFSFAGQPPGMLDCNITAIGANPSLEAFTIGSAIITADEP